MNTRLAAVTVETVSRRLVARSQAQSAPATSSWRKCGRPRPRPCVTRAPRRTLLRSSSAWIPARRNLNLSLRTCIPRTRMRTKPTPTDRPKIAILGSGPEPHRAGNRVRLLLLPRLVRAARRRLRNHHGELQSGDGFDRLRHLRPPVFRAAHARRRSGGGRTREAARRDRAVRRADAAESGAGTEAQRRADHRHRAGIDRSRRRPPPLWATARRTENSPAAKRHGAGSRGSRARRQGNRFPGAGAPQLCAGRTRHGDRLRSARRCRNMSRRPR